MLSNDLEMGVRFHRALFWGTWRDVPFLGSFRDREIFLIWEIFYEEFERYVKKTL
jgi:hypothetical protein